MGKKEVWDERKRERRKRKDSVEESRWELNFKLSWETQPCGDQLNPQAERMDAGLLLFLKPILKMKHHYI